MAMALALALPGKLELVAKALELIHQKDRAGQRLMLMMAKPRRPHKDETPGLYWFDDDARLKRLYEDCKQDIQVERELYLQLQPLIPQELKLWQLDFVINTRGFHFNRTLAEAARKIAQALGPELNAELKHLTGGRRDHHFSGCPAETMVSVARLRGRLPG